MLQKIKDRLLGFFILASPNLLSRFYQVQNYCELAALVPAIISMQIANSLHGRRIFPFYAMLCN